MYRRRQLTVPSSSARSPNVQLPFPMLVSDRLDATDSSSSPHQQPLESPHQDESQREMQHCSPSLLQSLPHVMKDTPLFTYRQVAHICESLVRKREEKVKEEYDKVLSCKLAGMTSLCLSRFSYLLTVGNQLYDHVAFRHSRMTSDVMQQCTWNV